MAACSLPIAGRLPDPSYGRCGYVKREVTHMIIVKRVTAPVSKFIRRVKDVLFVRRVGFAHTKMDAATFVGDTIALFDNDTIYDEWDTSEADMWLELDD